MELSVTMCYKKYLELFDLSQYCLPEAMLYEYQRNN